MGIAALFFVSPRSPIVSPLPRQGLRALACVSFFRNRADVCLSGFFAGPAAGHMSPVAGLSRGGRAQDVLGGFQQAFGGWGLHLSTLRARQPEALRRQARRKIFQSLRMERETSSRPEIRRKARTSPSSRAVNARRAARRIVAGSSRKASAPHCPQRARSLANRRRKPRPMRRNSSR